MQGNENGQVIILDNDGDTVHDVTRVVKNVVNHGWYKTGESKISGKTYNVQFDGTAWIGNAYDYQ